MLNPIYFRICRIFYFFERSANRQRLSQTQLRPDKLLTNVSLTQEPNLAEDEMHFLLAWRSDSFAQMDACSSRVKNTDGFQIKDENLSVLHIYRRTRRQQFNNSAPQNILKNKTF